MAQAKARGALLKGFRSGELQTTVDKMEAGAAQPDAASEAAAERERVRKLKMRAELDKMSQRMLKVLDDLQFEGKLATREEPGGTVEQAVSFDNLTEAVRRCELGFSDEETLDIFQQIDHDENGVFLIDEFHEFCDRNSSWVADAVANDQKSARHITHAGKLLSDLFRRIDAGNFRVVEVFFTVDTDGSGEMDRMEFEDALDYMNINLPTEDIDLAFQELDEDRGGTIEIEEFMSRFHREQKWRREDLAEAAQLAEEEEEKKEVPKKQEKMARLIESLSGDEQKVMIAKAGQSEWQLAALSASLAEWAKKNPDSEQEEDADYLAYQMEEAEARIAEAIASKEEEEARQAEEAHAQEEEEARVRPIPTHDRRPLCAQAHQ